MHIKVGVWPIAGRNFECSQVAGRVYAWLPQLKELEVQKSWS